MSKDQAIGGLILAVCVIVALAFVVLVVFPAPVANLLGLTVDSNTGNALRLYAVLALVSAAFIALLAIGAWIGYTMATTPAPKPIEEITADIQEDKTKDQTTQKTL